MSERTYLVVVATIAVGLIALTGREDPYGADFARRIVPTVVLLNAIQWLLPSIILISRLTGAVASLLITGLYLAVVVPQQVGFIKFAVAFSLLMAVNVAVLYRLPSTRSVNSIVVAQSLTLTFLILLGSYVNTRHVRFPSATGGKFLLWTPLAAMLLWIESATSSWNKWKRGLFIIMLGQISLGFLDTGMSNNILGMLIFSGLFFASALLLLVRWAEKFYPSKSSNAVSQ